VQDIAQSTLKTRVFSASTLLVGRQEEQCIRPVKLSDEVLVIGLKRGANELHMVQLMPLPRRHFLLIKIQNGLTFLVPAYSGCPGKEAIKRVSVCLSVCLKTHDTR